MKRKIQQLIVVLIMAMATYAIAGNYTTNLHMYKPSAGENGWATIVNVNNWDNLDNVVSKAITSVGLNSSAISNVVTFYNGPTNLYPASNYRSIPTSTVENSLAFSRMNTGLAADKILITEASFSTSYFYSPGAGYGNFWPMEFASSGTNFIFPELMDSSYLKGIVLWVMSHQIQNSNTTYTRPLSGGTDIYNIGTIPSFITPSGTASYTEDISDKGLLTAPFGLIDYVYMWGKSTNFNADWKSWFSSNSAKLINAMNSIPYNTSTGLVTQWLDGYKANGISVLHIWDGDHIYESILSWVAMKEMSSMFSIVSDSANASAWTAKANQVQLSVQSAFILEPSPLWDYMYDKFTGYPRQSGILAHWTASGAGITYQIVSNPSNSLDNIFRISSTGSAGYAQNKCGQVGTTIPGPFRGTFHLISSRSYPYQTNVGTYALYIQGAPNTNAMIIKYGEDGHLKYYNGAAWANMPTDRTYTADWHTVAATMNAGWTTAAVTIDGLAAGTINILDATDARGYILGMDTAATATIDYDYMRWSESPTTLDAFMGSGYLPWSTGLDGNNVFSPIATAYAVETGILTDSQNILASRWFNILYDQPTASGATSGWNNMFLKVANQHGPIRWTRWADDYNPGFESVHITPGTGSWAYGYFINGGYQHWMPAAILKTLSLTNQTNASTHLTNIMNGIAASSNSPYEKYRVDTSSPEGNLYLHPAINYYGIGRVTR
jgi:hypothetical protein